MSWRVFIDPDTLGPGVLARAGNLSESHCVLGRDQIYQVTFKICSFLYKQTYAKVKHTCKLVSIYHKHVLWKW